MSMTMSRRALRVAMIVTFTSTVWLGAGPVRAESNSTTAIVDATIFDATGALPRVGTVVIQNDRIAAVGAGIKVPRGARIIKARGKALLPGFFDVHTHWATSGVPATPPQIANAYLAAGVTTVNDFHQQPESYEPRRRWLSSLASPHVNLVARMSTPGGHGADWGDTATTRWVSTAEAAREEVRDLLHYRPDFIKVFADGWRYGTAPDNTSMNLPTLSAIVDEAHKNGLKVLTHTVTVECGKDAARARVDVIAHSLQDRQIDQETIELMRSNGVHYAPTLAIYEPVKPGAPARTNPDDPIMKLRVRKFGYALHNVKALHDAGVVVVVGTDSGISGAPHGVSTLHEMELLVQAGLTATEALTAATANSAKALGAIADRGTIEQGKRADLVLIDGAPWADISAVRKVDRVFVDGRLVHGKGAVVPKANSAYAMPPVRATALIDDFENPSGRSSLDTLRLDAFEGGADRSVEVSTVVARTSSDHALMVTARMSRKADPAAGVIIPLSRGSVEPIDATAFKGVCFEIRGDGGYTLSVDTLAGAWTANVTGGPDWRQVDIPFTALQRPMRRSREGSSQASENVDWSGTDLLQIELGGRRAPGSKFWMEIDNVSFCK
jgi:imidazolonepropionase-like amidohydrolase